MKIKDYIKINLNKKIKIETIKTEDYIVSEKMKNAFRPVKGTQIILPSKLKDIL